MSAQESCSNFLGHQGKILSRALKLLVKHNMCLQSICLVVPLIFWVTLEKTPYSLDSDFAKQWGKIIYLQPFWKYSDYLLFEDQSWLEISSVRSQSSSCLHRNTQTFKNMHPKPVHFRWIRGNPFSSRFSERRCGPLSREPIKVLGNLHCWKILL